MEAELIKQHSRRRFIRVSGWIIFSLGLVGTIIFSWLLFNSEKQTRIIAKRERDRVEDHSVRAQNDEKVFQMAKAMTGETVMLSNCIMAIIGIAMAICGLFLGLFRAAVPVSMALLIIYVIGSIFLFIVLGKHTTPVAILWRIGMTYWCCHLLYVATSYARAQRAV